MWQKEMERQFFYPMESTVREVVEFMERLEATEDFNPVKEDKGSAKKQSGNGKPYAKISPSDGKKTYGYCTLHVAGHNTEDYYTLKAKKIKGEHSSSSKYAGKSKSGSYQNKTWSRQANDNKVRTCKDLAAFIGK